MKPFDPTDADQRPARIKSALRLVARPPRPTEQYARIEAIAGEIVHIDALISGAIVDRHRTLLAALKDAAATLRLEAMDIEVASFPARSRWMIDEIVAERRDAAARKRASQTEVFYL